MHTRHLHQAIPTVVGKHRGREQREEAEEEEVATSMVKHLERLSLVDFADLKGVARLGEAVKLAGAVVDVDTTGVEPLYSTLELETLPVRQDLGLPPENRRLLMSNAVLTEEEYFVAPPGNVPLSLTKSYSE